MAERHPIEQQMLLFRQIGSLLFDCELALAAGFEDAPQSKWLMLETRRLLLALTNNYSKTRTFPLRLFASGEGGEEQLCSERVCTAAMLLGHERRQPSEPWTERKLVSRTVSLVTGTPRTVVRSHIQAMRNAGFIGIARNTPGKSHYLKLTEKFKRCFARLAMDDRTVGKDKVLTFEKINEACLGLFAGAPMETVTGLGVIIPESRKQTPRSRNKRRRKE